MNLLSKILRRDYQNWPPHLSPEVRLPSRRVAKFLGVSRRYLWTLRGAGLGPPYENPAETRYHAIWYRAADVLAWRASVLGEPETSAEAIIRRRKAETSLWVQMHQPDEIGIGRTYRRLGPGEV